MSLDWLTVAAQILNFLVLVWLLQRFLYGPITRAMTAREETLRKRADDAAEKQRFAEAEAERLATERSNLQARQEELLVKARSEAEALKATLEKEIRIEMDERRQAWRRDLEAEHEDFIAELRRNAVDHFYKLANRALGGLAGKTLNEAMAESFADRLADLGPDQDTKFKAAARQARHHLVIESSFDLSSGSRRRVTAAVHQHILPDAEIDYVRNADLICGVRMRAQGQVLAWSLDSYLDRMEQEAATFWMRRFRRTG